MLICTHAHVGKVGPAIAVARLPHGPAAVPRHPEPERFTPGRRAVTDNFLESFFVAGLDMRRDYNEFLEDNFLWGDEAGNLGAEEHPLQVFYGLYTSLSDDSGPFEEILVALCEQDHEYSASADDDERDDRRDAIVREVSSHLLEGLDRCGKDCYEILQAISYFNETLAEHRSLIDEIGGDAHCDEVDIEAMIDEVRRPVADLASSLASSTWFPSWEKDTYAIAEFAACLRKLRAQQDHDLATLKDRAEKEGSNLRSRFRQQRGQAE